MITPKPSFGSASNDGAVAHLMIVNFPELLAPILCKEQCIGRGRQSAIRIPDRFHSVSRNHASLFADKRGQMWLRDLGSKLGTAVNGVPLKSEHPSQIVIGDRILLGDVELGIISNSRIVTSPLPDAGDPETVETHKDAPLRDRTSSGPRELLDELTQAELEIVLWMCRGYTSLKSIGTRLQRSPHTVRTQLGKIFLKLGVHSRDELVGAIRLSSLSEDC